MDPDSKDFLIALKKNINPIREKDIFDINELNKLLIRNNDE